MGPVHWTEWAMVAALVIIIGAFIYGVVDLLFLRG